MTSVNLSLNAIDKVKNFVNVINTFEGDFDLSSERYVIDAKSIMGIFSLDISSPVKLTIHDDSEADAVKQALAEYIVD